MCFSLCAVFCQSRSRRKTISRNDQPFARPWLTPQQQALLEERLAAYDANPDAVLTMEQAAERMARFKEQLARKRSGGHE